MNHSEVVDTTLFSVKGVPMPRSALQGICKLQKQAAISDDLISGLQSVRDLGLSVEAFSQGNWSPAKLVASDCSIDKRLVLVVAQDGGIGQRNRVGNFARVHAGSYVHIFFQLLAGIARLDARLQRARTGIERSRDIRDASLKGLRVASV